MSKTTTSRLKVNPPLGMMPALQYAPPSMLNVDDSYQRSLDSSSSRSLISKIAQYWNWDLCQPLVVSRRQGGALYVIDGQHRLEAAKLRGDIQQLPCVIVEYASAADEAASFVNLNQQRRPLSSLDVFRAAVASGDKESIAISEAMTEAGVTLAPHSNHTAWEPGMVVFIGGIRSCWRDRGPSVTTEALTVLVQAYRGEVLQYGGTLFPGIAAVVHRGREYVRWTFVDILKQLTQAQWRNAMLRHIADNPNEKRGEAMAAVMMKAWREQTIPETEDPTPLPTPISQERIWCAQCDRAVTASFAEACRSRFCSLRSEAA